MSICVRAGETDASAKPADCLGRSPWTVTRRLCGERVGVTLSERSGVNAERMVGMSRELFASAGNALWVRGLNFVEQRRIQLGRIVGLAEDQLWHV